MLVALYYLISNILITVSLYTLVYWVEGSAVEVSTVIMNPLPFDIKVENMVWVKLVH